MATTARSKEECKEFFDAEDVLVAKAKKLAKLIRNSKHMIAFTGAGISTSAGIPDFRSGTNTVLKTGAGKWEVEAHNKKCRDSPDGKMQKITSRASADAMRTAFPTYTHMALKALIDVGRLKCLVSQNTDGLHIRSGVPKKNFAELHGNRNLERCTRCRMEFLRDWRVRRPGIGVHQHKTGAKCESCGGALVDTIVNFGENLPAHEIDLAFAHAEKADLALALGSSLTVTPAADVPADVARKNDGSKLVIVNLQKTPLDGIADFRINGFTDKLMALVMRELEIDVPAWKLTRGVEVELVQLGSGGTTHGQDMSHSGGTTTTKLQPKKQMQLKVCGFNPDNGQPHHYFKSVQVDAKVMDDHERQVGRKNKNVIAGGNNMVKFEFPVRQECFLSAQAGGTKVVALPAAKIKISFMGHYKEPVLELPLCKETLRAEGKQFFVLRLNFENMQWEVEERGSRRAVHLPPKNNNDDMPNQNPLNLKKTPPQRDDDDAGAKEPRLLSQLSTGSDEEKATKGPGAAATTTSLGNLLADALADVHELFADGRETYGGHAVPAAKVS